MQPRPRETQSARTVVMVRPAAFAANPDTLSSNSFQDPSHLPRLGLEAMARTEFDGLRDALRAAGVEVRAFDDATEPRSPDAVFPNNWLSTHADGTVVIYPLCASNRRSERRLDLIDALRTEGFECSRLLDLTAHEVEGRFLEGTGSLVLDRIDRVAYACISPRTEPRLLRTWCDELGYEPLAFDAHDRSGREIYHTNVMLCVGTGYAVVCLAAVRDPRVRAALQARLVRGGHELVEISLEQMHEFTGNMLELRARDGTAVLALSERAHSALDPAQRARLAGHARLVVSAIPTIESAGGGSVRCMLAEVFLPRTAGAVHG